MTEPKWPIASTSESEPKLKSKEVFTDETVVIGSTDDTESLEALPITCGVLIVSKPEQSVAGMIHFSLGVYEEGITVLVSDLESQLGKNGLKLSDCNMRLFNAGETLSLELANVLSGRATHTPPSEMMPQPGLRVEKKSGEVTFFTP